MTELKPTKMKTITLYSFSSKVSTWYIDFTEGDEYAYSIHQDEKFRTSKYTLAEALEYIITKVESVNWQVR